MNAKNEEQNRSKPAYIYLRKSTPSQVRHHQESTERQYALREKALELGWSESLIHTLDRDLGKTGTEMARREGFQTLGGEGSMGQGGAGVAFGGSTLAALHPPPPLPLGVFRVPATPLRRERCLVATA